MLYSDVPNWNTYTGSFYLKTIINLIRMKLQEVHLMDFKDKIRQLREDNHMSQRELAEKLHLTRSVISKWETGRRYPDYFEMCELKKVFNISIDSLFSTDDVRNMAEVSPIIEQKPESSIEILILTAMLAISVVMCIFDFTEYLSVLAVKTDIKLLTVSVCDLVTVGLCFLSVLKYYGREINTKWIGIIVAIYYIKFIFGSLLELLNNNNLFNRTTILLFGIIVPLLFLTYILIFFWSSRIKNNKSVIIISCIQIEIYMAVFVKHLQSIVLLSPIDSSELIRESVIFLDRVLPFVLVVFLSRFLGIKRTNGENS